MADFSVTITGMREFREAFQRMVDRGANRDALLATAGAFKREEAMGKVLTGPFRAVKAWPRLMRSGARNLFDRARIFKSIGYRVGVNDVSIGTAVPYAGRHNRGAVVVPRGRWLAISQSPPLRQAESHKKTSDFRAQGSFVLMRGPEGPGIYRKTTAQSVRRVTVVRGNRRNVIRKKPSGIERIFAFVRSTRLPKREFLAWNMPSLAEITRRWTMFIATGQMPGGIRPVSYGSLDVGP